jgi:ABC-2 type transport system ATP-binding protein
LGVIEIQDLRKDFAHDEIIRELNLAIHPGETLGLWGRPKSGISTLMDLIAGILTPTTGRVLIDDRNAVVDRTYVAKVLAYVPERLALPAGMRVRDIVHFAASLRGLPNPRYVANHINEKLGLEDCWDLRFGHLTPSCVIRDIRPMGPGESGQAVQGFRPEHRRRLPLLHDAFDGWLSSSADFFL